MIDLYIYCGYYNDYNMSTAILTLPNNLSKYFERTLSLDDVSMICAYQSNVTYNDRKNVLFDAGKYTGITFISGRGKYSIFALPDDLMSGPEYYINKNSIKGNEPNFELRDIVIDYLDKHKELGLNIDDFL